MSKYIALDAGHGENTYETGGGKGVKVGGKVYEEHHFNAEVVAHAKAGLEKHGFKVMLTQPLRGNDVPLRARTNKANSAGVDFLVSVHANAGVKSANGACAFYWHTSSSGKKFAQKWVSNFKSMVDGVGTHGNGLHASKPGLWTNLHMVRETRMPAVLIEHGFMTNDHDFEYIFGKHKDKYRKQCAEAIVKTVCDYFGVTYKGETKNVAKPSPTPVPAPSKPKPKPKPSGNATIRKIQTTLNSRYKAGLAVDGLYGPKTKKALVKAYQTELNKQFNRGLVVDGIFGPKTKAASVNVRKGARGNLTWILQAALYVSGHDPKGIDGIFGANTEKAVKSFQRAKGLSVDGIAGKNTWSKLLG